MLSCLKKAFDHDQRPSTIQSGQLKQGVKRRILLIWTLERCRKKILAFTRCFIALTQSVFSRLKVARRCRCCHDCGQAGFLRSWSSKWRSFRPGPIQGGMVHPYLQRRQGRAGKAIHRRSPSCKRTCLKRTLGCAFVSRASDADRDRSSRIFTPAEADELRRAMATFKRVGTIGNLKG